MRYCLVSLLKQPCFAFRHVLFLLTDEFPFQLNEYCTFLRGRGEGGSLEMNILAAPAVQVLSESLQKIRYDCPTVTTEGR